MSINLELLKESNLRNCQRDALEIINNYIISTETLPALVKMPTGTGKTGLIAISSQLKDEDVVLILAPNASLPIQIFNEIQTNFWKKINYHEKDIKQAIVIKDSYDLKACKFDETPILIMTIQLLLNISKEKVLYSLLLEKVNLVIFDEGHHEPAKYWSEIIDSFCCKKIFFTATPYRNDNIFFETNSNYVYQYYTQDAIKNGDILKPNFKYYDDNLLDNNDELVSWILKIKNKNKNKILIRLSGHERIENLVSALNKESVCAVGFHSQAKKLDNMFLKGKDIYNLEDNFKIIVNEDMFVEGLDLDKLETIILLDCFENAKSFIQQVGRVLRTDLSNKKPIVYIRKSKFSFWKSQWDLFMKFDSKHIKKSIVYINNFFNKIWDIYNDEINEYNIKIPERATIFCSKSSMYKKAMISIIKRIKVRKDLKNWPCFEKNKFWIVYYEKDTPTNYLFDSIYQNTSLEFSCIYEKKCNEYYYLFYSDSVGLNIPINTDLKRVSALDLQKLLNSGADVRNIRLNTTLYFGKGINSRNVNGNNLENIPQSLTDRLSYLSSVTAVQNNTRRLINPSNAKVSDDKYVLYGDYVNWCDQMIKTINTSISHNGFFDKHSFPVDPISDIPSNICIYLNTEIQNYKKTDREYIDTIYCKVDTTNCFNITIEKKLLNCKLVKLGTDKVKIESADLNNYIVCSSGVSVLEYINSGNFTLFYFDKHIIYISGTYYKTNIKTRYNPPLTWDTWSNIISLDNLKDCDEKTKGTNPPQDNVWPDKSVFRVIIDEIKNNYSEINYLVCTDLGNEISDFIGISTTKKKVYFIHCKGKKAIRSASALQDVYGQASKNSYYLFMQDELLLECLKDKYSRWESKWEVSSKKYGTITKDRKAIFPSGETMKNFESKLKELLANKDGSTKKEVWIVTAGLSKAFLEKQLSIDISKKQNNEFQQIMWFTQNLQDTFSSINVKMKIFCKK